jgi:hypothetical protein
LDGWESRSAALGSRIAIAEDHDNDQDDWQIQHATQIDLAETA